MLQSTLKERLWEQAQARETQFIAAQSAVQAMSAQVAEVTASYTFTRDDLGSFFSPSGKPVQLAMQLTGKGESVTIVCRTIDGELLWLILDIAARLYDAQVYIKAVQQRIEANRQSRTGGVN